VRAIVVDAWDAAATPFYQKFGFVALACSERRLFLPMATARRMLQIKGT